MVFQYNFPNMVSQTFSSFPVSQLFFMFGFLFGLHFSFTKIRRWFSFFRSYRYAILEVWLSFPFCLFLFSFPVTWQKKKWNRFSYNMTQNMNRSIPLSQLHLDGVVVFPFLALAPCIMVYLLHLGLVTLELLNFAPLVKKEPVKINWLALHEKNKQKLFYIVFKIASMSAALGGLLRLFAWLAALRSLTEESSFPFSSMKQLHSRG